MLFSALVSTGFDRESVVLALPPDISSAKLQGSGRLTWWGLHIYDFAFYWVGLPTSADFVLNVRYQKSFFGTSMANRSVEEMKRISVPKDQAALWGKELTAFLPNVEPGQTLTAMHPPTRHNLSATCLSLGHEAAGVKCLVQKT